MTASSDNLTHVNRGDNVVEHLTAERFNAYTDAANWFKRVNTNDNAKYSDIRDRPALVDLRAVAGFERLHILGLESIGIPFANRNEALTDIFRADFSAAVPTASHQGKFAVALEDVIQSDDVATGIASGVCVCRLFVPANGDWIQRADIDTSDSTRLLATPNGSAQILWKDTGTNTTVDAIVRLGNPQFVALKGTAQGDIDADTSTGVMRVRYPGNTDTAYDVENVHLDWMAQGLKISDGKQIIIGWFPLEQLWRVIHAECEDNPPAIGQMAFGPASTTSQALTDTPAAWNCFDPNEELATANVTVDSGAATIQVPDVPSIAKGVYEFSVSGTLTPGSPNVTYLVDTTTNGTPSGYPLQIDGRSAGATTSFSASRIISFPVGTGPVLGLTIAMAAGTDTITWNGASFTLKRNLDF